MDNATHTLAGLMLADAAVLALPRPPSPAVRTVLRLGSALANNFPDLDFVYSGITAGKLGYLLHHRGHTHTLPVGLLLGALTFALVLGIARVARTKLETVERRALLWLSLAGPVFHIALDFTNNYGVHPFWPFHDGWFFGDSVFIVEPWFWILTLPPLAFASGRVGRVVCALLLVAAVVLAWTSPFAGPLTALFLSGGSVGVAVVAGRSSSRGRVVLGLGGWALVTLLFVAASARAETLVRASVAPEKARVVDVVLTPGPANPFCFSAVIVAERDAEYDLRTATVSVAPGIVRPERCGLQALGGTLDLRPPRDRGTASVRFEGEHQAPIAELGELWQKNCQAAAFLRWSRVPFWLERGSQLYLGDLRYDRTSDEGFAELRTARFPAECPRRVPPWIPPRADLVAGDPQARERPE
jgi:inner membrane protein